MFTRARLKLTVWYVVILMSVCVLFSGAIYRVVTSELQRGYQRAQTQLRARELTYRISVPAPIWEFLQDDFESARHRLLFGLLMTNGAILFFSAGASFLLAGKTLDPIQRSLEEQKRFVADASHELHTPLTALKTSIEVALREKRLTIKEARSVLENSLTEVDELAALNENLLSLARFEKNHVSVSSRVDLIDVLHIVIRRLTPLAKKKGIHLDTKIGSEVVLGDEASLQKLFTILVDNAIKYTPHKGTVTVATQKQRKQVRVTIADTGIGIAKKDVSHIFDRFYRADSSRAKQIDGFGLGLAIAEYIVELHKGSIAVKSKIGKGSTFEVLLPLK